MKYFNPPRDRNYYNQNELISQSQKIDSFGKYWAWHGLWHSHKALKQKGIQGPVDANVHRLRHLKLQILLHYFRNFFYFPIFLFKFLIPSFMKGRVNLITNLKTIIKEKEFKPLRIAILSQFLFILILTQLGILVYKYYTNPSRTATMFLTQTNWGGGASTTLSASHSSDQTGWSRFYSTSSADVNTSVAGEVSLSPSLSTSAQTSDTDFNSWEKTGVYRNGSGSSGQIVLLKPDGASCTTGTQCLNGGCNGSSVCYTPPCAGLTSVSYSGQTYNLVTIGTQCWFSQNLNVGTMLASAATMPSNNSLIEKWCYANSTGNCTTYGGLYTWAEMLQIDPTYNTNSYTPSANTQGICPSGWHIPTDVEVQTLEIYLGMCSGTGAGCAGATGDRGSGIGTKLKSGGSSGFNLLYAGHREGGGTYELTTVGYLWTSSEQTTSYAYSRLLSSSFSTVHRADPGSYYAAKTYGRSVRCLKN